MADGEFEPKYGPPETEQHVINQAFALKDVVLALDSTVGAAGQREENKEVIFKIFHGPKNKIKVNCNFSSSPHCFYLCLSASPTCSFVPS